jgi:hypothetical protein
MRVRFDEPVPDSSLPHSGKWRAKAAALLAGCCVTALPIASVPTTGPQAAQESPVHIERAAGVLAQSGVGESFTRVIAAPIVERPGSLPPVNAPPPVAVVPANPLPHGAVEVSNSPRPSPGGLPQPIVIEAAIVPDIPRIAVAPLPRPPIAVSLPDPIPAPSLAMAETPPSAPPAAASPPLAAPRKVDIVQIAESEVHPPRVPQLHEPGLAAGTGETLATKIAAMQVTPPPPVRLRDSDRARLLAEAPTNMILRIGDSALGKVDFRMTDAHGIDVKLAGLLDLLAGHYDAAEFARLRGSAAADAYVSFDQLRALGLSVRYDPVYDELRING